MNFVYRQTFEFEPARRVGQLGFGFKRRVWEKTRMIIEG
jgi:hypothetical protein